MIRPHDLTPSLMALLGAAGLGGLALVVTLMPSQAVSMAVESDAATTVALEKPPAHNPPAFKNYAIISERPLFNAGRAKDYIPPPQPAAPTKPRLPPLSDYRLVGLVVSGEIQRALVARPSGDVVKLQPGDDLDGRKVTGIDARGVSLSGDDKEERLVFPRAGARSAQGMAMATGSAQANP